MQTEQGLYMPLVFMAIQLLRAVVSNQLDGGALGLKVKRMTTRVRSLIA
jgi:hypothetical protein